MLWQKDRCVIRQLGPEPQDIELGRALVQEYTDATALEMEVDVAELLPFIPDYHEFPGRYKLRGSFLLAEVDGAPAGCVGIALVDDEICEMNRLWIRPAFRGLGLGRELIKACIIEARGLGFSNLVLEVLPSREKAISLYRQLGFVDRPQVHDYGFEMAALEMDVSQPQTLAKVE